MSHDWFEESERGRFRVGYAVKERLFKTVSRYQEIEVFDTASFGRMLAIDGVVMLSEMDEFVYHEMMAHVPVCYHTSLPRKILVIGGGDGGTIRELVRYPFVEQLTLCEIDGDVVEACKKFFPQISAGLSDPRVSVHIGDGIAYMQQATELYDLIIVDSTDPVGPGEGLFTSSFYRSVARSLTPNGMMVAQTESPWDDAGLIGGIYGNIRKGFEHVYPYAAPVATYPRGFWSWTLASKNSLSPENVNWDRFETVSSGLSYLTAAKLSSVFDVSPFHRRKLEKST